MENIIHFEFFEEIPSALKHIYVSYSAAGGAFYENYITSKFKYFSWCLVSFQYVLYNAILIAAILQQEHDHKLITSCILHLIFMHVLVSKAAIVYWKRDTFRALFDQISQLKDDEFIKPNFNFTSNQIDEINIENINSQIINYHLAFTLGVFFAKLLLQFSTYIFTGEFTIDYSVDFAIPFPSVNSQTPLCYTLIHCMILVISPVLPIVMYGTTYLPALISIYLKNQAIRLQNDMKYHTDLIFECMEECERREEKVLDESPKCERVRNFQLRDIQRQRDRNVEEFMLKVRQWIKFHQKWILCANLFKKSVSQLLGIHVVTCYAGIIAPGYNILKMILDSSESGYENISYAVVNTLHLLAACAFVNVLPEVSDDLSTAIYSMPWYYLPVKDQKVLLQFLALTQNSPKISIFNVFPLSLEKFPELLNDAYGYIQLIRILEMKVN